MYYYTIMYYYAFVLICIVLLCHNKIPRIITQQPPQQQQQAVGVPLSLDFNSPTTQYVEAVSPASNVVLYGKYLFKIYWTPNLGKCLVNWVLCFSCVLDHWVVLYNSMYLCPCACVCMYIMLV